MKYLRQRISDYVDEPRGVWKYLMKSSHSDYLVGVTSCEEIDFNKSYGKKHLGYKYSVMKITM